MLRSTVGKITWMARATTTVVGLAIMLALVVGGVASTAFGANGDFLKLGTAKNVATKATALVGKVATGSSLVVKNPSGGSALGLQVNAGQAPLSVNVDAGKATNLDADKLDGKEASDFYAQGSKVADSTHADQADSATNAQNAANADTLDNKDSTEFLGKTEKAADADKLDGKDSAEFANATHAHSGADVTSGTVAEARIDGSIARDNEVSNGFVQGRGIARHGARAIAPGGGTYTIVLDMPDPGLFVSYLCPTDLTTNGWLRIRNTGSETVNVFSDNGSTNPNHFGELAPTAAFEQAAAASGEYITLQVQGSSVTTIDVFSAHRSGRSDCHVQAQALVTKP